MLSDFPWVCGSFSPICFWICFLDVFFADEKPELSTNLWYDFNDKKLELSLILDEFF